MLPYDIEWTGKLIQDICYNNAKQYFAKSLYAETHKCDATGDAILTKAGHKTENQQTIACQNLQPQITVTLL